MHGLILLLQKPEYWGKLGHHYFYRCHGFSCRQGISNHGTYFAGSRNPYLPWETIWAICAITVMRNRRKWKYRWIQNARIKPSWTETKFETVLVGLQFHYNPFHQIHLGPVSIHYIDVTRPSWRLDWTGIPLFVQQLVWQQSKHQSFALLALTKGQ